jgi:hypothetical protein
MPDHPRAADRSSAVDVQKLAGYPAGQVSNQQPRPDPPAVGETTRSGLVVGGDDADALDVRVDRVRGSARCMETRWLA